MNALIKDALKLVIITVVAGLVLGAVYGITKGPIADQEAKAQMEAYKTVFPKASDFKEVDGFSEEAASKIIAANENPIEGHDSDVISSAVEAVDASGEALGYIFNITTSINATFFCQQRRSHLKMRIRRIRHTPRLKCFPDQFFCFHLFCPFAVEYQTT